MAADLQNQSGSCIMHYIMIITGSMFEVSLLVNWREILQAGYSMELHDSLNGDKKSFFIR